MVGGEVGFDWRSVNCFLRPQVLLCDQIAPGYGRLFLFLTSAYRAFGFDGYFNGAARHHFAFASTAVRAATGLQFAVEHVDRSDHMMDALERRLRSGRPVIVPANIRCLDYFASYGAVDQTHYFIVTGIDHGTGWVSILDNLHLTPDNTSTEYADHALPVQVFAALVRHYWQTHVARPGPTSDGETFWLLQIEPDAHFARRGEAALADLIISEYRQYVSDLARGRDHQFVDDRYLDALEHFCAAGRRDLLPTSMRGYLAECRLATVHVSILIRLLEHSDPDTAASLAERLEQYHNAATARRTQLLVNCLKPTGVSPDEWRDMRAELSALGAGLRSAIAASLPRPRN
jgi:hypothetical protein